MAQDTVVMERRTAQSSADGPGFQHCAQTGIADAYDASFRYTEAAARGDGFGFACLSILSRRGVEGRRSISQPWNACTDLVQ